MRRMRTAIAAVATAAFAVAAGTAHAGATFDAVKKKGFVQCGVNNGLAGFSVADEKGVWKGIDVDVCRAVAAAVFGDATKVKYTPLTAKERFTALQSGEIDILSRNTTWTLTPRRRPGHQLHRRDLLRRAGLPDQEEARREVRAQADGATVCVQSGTTTELNLADYFGVHKMKFKPVVYDTADETVKSFEAGRCDVLTSDQSQLYALRIKLAEPDSAIVLPEVISKEPLGPAVRQGDDRLVQHRPLVAVRDDQRRGPRRDLGERRRDEGQQEPERQAPARRRIPSSTASASPTTGRTRSSSRWATTPRSSTGTWGPAARSRSSAD